MNTNKILLLLATITLMILTSTQAKAKEVTNEAVTLIRQHLSLDSRIHPANIVVTQKGESIVLSGTVMSLAEKQLVEETVERIWGGNYSSKNLKVIPLSVADNQIQKNIEATIPAHCQLEIENLQVEVRNGNVTLKGKTTALHHRILAGYVAANTRGVRNVINDIQVSGARQSDELIRQNILSLLESYVKENGGQLDVAVDDGKITLRGEVLSFDQEKYIRQTAENVPGVTFVESKITRKTTSTGDVTGEKKTEGKVK